MRRLIASWLGRPLIARMARRFLEGRATIFMLHRFADPDRGSDGIPAATVSALLAAIRREGLPIRPLGELIDRWEHEPSSLAGDVAFTVDDGYADFASVGAPTFAQFDAPVTVFLVTGFVDQATWLWWDQLAWIASSSHGALSVPIPGGPPINIAGDQESERLAAAGRAADQLKVVRDSARIAAIAALAKAAEVALPTNAPPRYQPMSWDQIRSLSRRGVTFGPHTVTHPILSQTDPDASRWEIETSWTRLKAEVPDSVPIFCYPNGTSADFGAREEQGVATVGLRAALSTKPGYLTGRDPRFRLPRFALPSTLGAAVQVAFGVERAKAIARGES